MSANDLSTRLQNLSMDYQIALRKSQCCANTEEWVNHSMDAAACQFEMYLLIKEVSLETAKPYRAEAIRLLKEACKVIQEKNLLPVPPKPTPKPVLPKPTPKPTPKPVPPKPTPKPTPKPVPPKPSESEKDDPERAAMLKELEGFDPASTRIWELPSASFEDYGQMDDAVQSIVDALEIMDGLRRYPNLAKKARDIKLNALLVGPPGGGKSHFCRAIGNYVMQKFNSPFYMVTASDIKHSHVGVTEKRIRALFDEVKKHGADALPVIILDEIDALCPDRNSSANNASHVQSLVSEFLQCIDGVAGKTNAVIVGASNYPWLVDRALRSRLTKNVYVGLPSEGHIYDFLNKNIRQYLDKNNEVACAQLWKCAEEFKNASYRDLNAFCDDVAILSLKITFNTHPQTSDFIPLNEEQLTNLCKRTKKRIEYNPKYIGRLKNPDRWNEESAVGNASIPVSSPIPTPIPETLFTPEQLALYEPLCLLKSVKNSTAKTDKPAD